LSVLPSGPEPVWLPGNVEVQVSGETFHAAAIREADRHRPPGVTDVAVLVLEPNNPHDHSAIAVFVNGFLAGHLSREIAGAVQPSLIAFAAANCGRTVACPARIIWHEIDNQPVAQVVLRLDPAPLGLTPDDFRPVPEIDRVIQQHLQRLDITAPVMTGCDTAARSLLRSGKTKTEAKTKLRELLRDQDDGVPTPVDGYTVADAVAYWLTYGLRGRDEATVSNYTTLTKTHILPTLGRRKLRELSAEDVDQWLTTEAYSRHPVEVQPNNG